MDRYGFKKRARMESQLPTLFMRFKQFGGKAFSPVRVAMMGKTRPVFTCRAWRGHNVD